MVIWNPYGARTGSEIDLRREITSFLDGSFPEIAKKQKIVFRKMRRDSSGNLILCACVNPSTHEPDKDTFCPLCNGEGYFWDEAFMDIYKRPISGDNSQSLNEVITAPGLLNIPLTVFYTRYTEDITINDKLVTVKLDTEGEVIMPYRRIFLYRIGTLIDYRSDNGRLEYWKIACYQEERKFLNGPAYP